MTVVEVVFRYLTAGCALGTNAYVSSPDCRWGLQRRCGTQTCLTERPGQQVPWQGADVPGGGTEHRSHLSCTGHRQTQSTGSHCPPRPRVVRSPANQTFADRNHGRVGRDMLPMMDACDGPFTDTRFTTVPFDSTVGYYSGSLTQRDEVCGKSAKQVPGTSGHCYRQ